jgi:SulP family sulfate permease
VPKNKKSNKAYRFLPMLNWWPMVNKSALKADAFAGLTNAVVVLPQGVAFAMIAGLPPIYGLYTAMIIPVIAALFGSSFHLISGPTTAISIVIFSAISQFAEPGSSHYIELVLVVTFLAGVIQLIMGLVRFGSLVNFVSHSVIIGFTSGAAILIATSQLPHALGLELSRGLSFHEKWIFISSNFSEINLYVLTISASTLTTAILLKIFIPKSPYLIISMVVGSIVNILISGEKNGVEMLTQLNGSLPGFSIPNLSFENIELLTPNAFAIALLGLIEAVAIARSIALKSGQEINGNQEFIGQGVSNIVGSFFSSYAGSGSFTRSGINFQSGAKTPISAVFAAVSLMLILFFVAPLTAFLPIPAIGGIILLVAFNLIDFKEIKEVAQLSKSEFSVLGVTFLATLFFHLEFAIYIGVFLSFVYYLRNTIQKKLGK